MTYCKGESCPHWRPRDKRYLEVKCEYSGVQIRKDGTCLQRPYEVKK